MEPVDQIADLVKAFCARMNAWEMKCMARMNGSKGSQLSPADSEKVRKERDEIRLIFGEFCIPGVSPEKRSFASPPDYDPNHFEIMDIRVKGKTAMVSVKELSSGFTPTLYTYHLQFTAMGWRLKDRRDYVFLDSKKKGHSTL